MRKSYLLVITSAIMIAGEMATPGKGKELTLAEVSRDEARNFVAREKARLAVPGVDYNTDDHPDVANNDGFGEGESLDADEAGDDETGEE